MSHNEQSSSNIKEVKDLIVNSEQKTEIATEADYNDDHAFRAKMRQQQECRTERITEILSNYKLQQQERYKYKKEMKPKVFWLLFSLVCVIVALLIGWCIAFICLHKIDSTSVVALVSGFITCLGSVLSILIIIVKYVFPEGEDANFNTLVTTIIENDTKRIKDDNDFQIGKKNDK